MYNFYSPLGLPLKISKFYEVAVYIFWCVVRIAKRIIFLDRGKDGFEVCFVLVSRSSVMTGAIFALVVIVAVSTVSVFVLVPVAFSLSLAWFISSAAWEK